MKLIQIVNMLESLTVMANLPLSAKDSFYLNDLLITFEDKFNSYNKSKNNSLMQYATSGDGVNYTFNNDDDKKAFINELIELDNKDIEITLNDNKIKVGLSKLNKLVEKLGEVEARHLYNVKDIIEFYDDTETEN